MRPLIKCALGVIFCISRTYMCFGKDWKDAKHLDQDKKEQHGNFTEMIPPWWIIFSVLPISCPGEMGVLAVMLKHTMADIQVTSLPPL